MSIISTIGRKSLRVRLLIWTIYALLSLGAVTMLYPFMLMVAGSSKSDVDKTEIALVPAFLRQEDALYRKHIEGLFNESLQMMQVAYDSNICDFKKIALDPQPNAKLAKFWLEFIATEELPHYAYTCGYIEAKTTRGVIPLHLRSFKAECLEKYNGDIAILNRALDTEFYNWDTFRITAENYLQRRSMPLVTPFRSAFYAFKTNMPSSERYYFDVEGYFKAAILKTVYTKDITTYNRQHGTSHASWDTVHLDVRLPERAGRTRKEREDWTSFVREQLNLLWIRVDPEAEPLYRRYLKAKYSSIAILNQRYGTEYSEFGEIPLIHEPPLEGVQLSDWDAFIQGWKDGEGGKEYIAPASMLRIHSVDARFRDYAHLHFKTIAAFNQEMGADYRDWSGLRPPQRDLHQIEFQKQKKDLKLEFLTRNFASVIDYMVLHGRSILNTGIYCFLAILSALVVNPLAAYALSRYKPPTTYKMLLFLMMTMAFPPMVTQIPNFLMLRDFGLLNSYWALILPGMANGYSIFLLKGFFDSLPQELYESAELDGAGEFRIFLQITMSLSKPILAVIALQSFTIAYGNFMMALLICQDENMWTLMPWLYQLQQRSDQGIIFASLLIAAVPTFLVFVFCQKIIMRGIVVPVEK